MADQTGEQILGNLTIMLIAIGGFAMFITLFPMMFNVESLVDDMEGSGEFEIDQEPIDNINEHMGDLTETVLEPFNPNFILFLTAGAIAIVVGAFFFIIFK